MMFRVQTAHVPGTRNIKTEPGTSSMSKNLRAEMPTVTAWIDDLRAVFGADQINPQIKSGIAGQPTFWARKNGIEIGTRALYDANKAIALSDTVISSKNATAAPHASRKGK